MKYTLAAPALLSGIATAAQPHVATEIGKRVRVNIDAMGAHNTWLTGDTVQPVSGDGHQNIKEIFYLDQRCHLPLAASENMRYYYDLSSHREGCWFPTMDDGHTVVYNNGQTLHSIIEVMDYPVGMLRPDNTFHILERDYDSNKWQDKEMAAFHARNQKRWTQPADGDPQR